MTDSSGMLWQTIWGLMQAEDAGSGARGTRGEWAKRAWRAGWVVWLSMPRHRESGRNRPRHCDPGWLLAALPKAASAEPRLSRALIPPRGARGARAWRSPPQPP